MMKKIKENGFGDSEKIISLVLITAAFIATIVMIFMNVYNV